MKFNMKGVMCLGFMSSKNHGSRGSGFAAESVYNVQEVKAGVELKLTQGASIYINTGNSQNQGARPYQEDSFGYSNIIDTDIVSKKGLLAILSDGMGGLSNGKSVADYAVQASIAMFDAINPQGNIPEQLKKIVSRINSNVCERFVSEDGRSKAGATIVVAYIFKNRIYWITVGDSRLYCFRNGNLLQMNEDHDYKNQLYREYLQEGGNLRAVEENNQKDKLVCFVGRREIPYMDVSLKGYRIKPNDAFVLCSDGVYNGISSDEMRDILSEYDAQTASDKIISNILKSRFPGQDNMTVMVIKCERKQ